MQGYNFPWSDFHELNFDWLMKKFKFLSSKIEKIPTKVSQLVNDLGFINVLQASAAAPVQSVNGQAGNVVLDASDVGALPDTYTPPVTSVNSQTGAVVLAASDVGAIPAGTGILVDSVTGAAQAIAAGSTTWWTTDVTKSGYTPLAVVGIEKAGAGSSYSVAYNWTVSGNNAQVGLRNLHASNNYTITPTFYILYLKN